MAGDVFNFQIPLINRSVGDILDMGDELLGFDPIAHLDRRRGLGGLAVH